MKVQEIQVIQLAEVKIRLTKHTQILYYKFKLTSQTMKKKKLNLEQLKVNSFVTELQMSQLIGASGCCLHDSEPGGNCYTFGHEGDCGSTGNTDNPTGRMSQMDM